RSEGGATTPVSSAIRRGSTAARNSEMVKLGARVGATYASASARKVFASAERRLAIDHETELKTASQVADRLGNMKGALMKLGQMASYLDEGLPAPLRAALAQLQSSAPPMSADLAADVIERELGGSPDRLFVEWDPDPIAAASIGQVHRAVIVDPLTRTERAVAVKVQYPGVDQAIDADLRNADLLGALLAQGFSGLDPSEMVNEVKERIREELDYGLEARNQTLFADYYRGHPFIRIPEVVPTFSTARVLTTELVSGMSWADFTQRDQESKDRAAECLFRFVFRSLYGMHAFNGDPHPGNYLFHEDGSITFLDF
ncbi:MAG: ABC1 kinase family protein, partial [Actinomycetota bacterium]